MANELVVMSRATYNKLVVNKDDSVKPRQTEMVTSATEQSNIRTHQHRDELVNKDDFLKPRQTEIVTSETDQSNIRTHQHPDELPEQTPESFPVAKQPESRKHSKIEIQHQQEVETTHPKQSGGKRVIRRKTELGPPGVIPFRWMKY
jgi:hypothetical protein